MTLKSNAVPFAGGSGQSPIEPGNYPARVVQVIDLGLQAQRPYEGKDKPPAYEIMVTYELGTEFMKNEDGTDDETRPLWISERFALFPLNSDRAKSTKRYLSLDPAKKFNGDWAQLVGKACLVAVVNNQNKNTGKIYNNVGGVSLPIKGMVVPELVNTSKILELDNPDVEVFTSLPDWIKTIISEGLDFPGSKLQGMLMGAPHPKAPAVQDEETDEVPY